MSNINNTEINNRDRDFFKFEEMSKQIVNKYVEEHPNCDVNSDDGLRKILSDLLIQNVKVSVTESGNVSKNLFGHKIKDLRYKDNSLKGICVTLYGNYEEKTREYNNLDEFNKWYENEIKKCQKRLNKTEEKETVEVTSRTQKETSSFNSVVFSIEGNDYCFEGLTGCKFVFKKNGDNGIRFSLERLVG